MIASPTFILFSFANAEAAPFHQLTCPAMTALPVSPGFGPSLYHAVSRGSLGVPMAPSLARPTGSIAAFTPIAAMRRRTGAPVLISLALAAGTEGFLTAVAAVLVAAFAFWIGKASFITTQRQSTTLQASRPAAKSLNLRISLLPKDVSRFDFFNDFFGITL